MDWFGLRFAPNISADPATPVDPAKSWILEARPDAAAAQQQNFSAFMAHSNAK